MSTHMRETGKPYLLVMFFAEWCGACKNFSPVFEDLHRSWPSRRVSLAKSNVAHLRSKKFKIEAIPTFILLNRNQEIVDSSQGASRGSRDLKQWTLDAIDKDQGAKQPESPRSVVSISSLSDLSESPTSRSSSMHEQPYSESDSADQNIFSGEQDDEDDDYDQSGEDDDEDDDKGDDDDDDDDMFSPSSDDSSFA